MHRCPMECFLNIRLNIVGIKTHKFKEKKLKLAVSSALYKLSAISLADICMPLKGTET